MSNKIQRTGPDMTAVLRPRTMQEAMDFANTIAKSDLVPKDYRNRPANVLAAVQMGAEVGLAPLQALQNIAVINGRPSLWGDAMLALVRSHPDCVDVVESFNGDTATCTVKRRGCSDVTQSFGRDDARLAGLLNKQGPWQQYPKRMLQMRARAFALRDAFPDALKGLQSAEESRDIEVQATVSEPAARPAAASSEPVVQGVIEEPERPVIEDPSRWQIPFGKNTGKALVELNVKQLNWYRNNFEKRANDPELAQYKKVNLEGLVATEAEIERRLKVEAEAAHDPPPVTTARGEEMNPVTGEIVSEEDPSYLDADGGTADPFTEEDSE